MAAVGDECHTGMSHELDRAILTNGSLYLYFSLVTVCSYFDCSHDF